MYSRIVWCYVLVLGLVDLSLKTSLTAQGKSHGKIDFVDASVNGHDYIGDSLSLPEEWSEVGRDAEEEAAAMGVRLTPPRLQLGPRPLGTAHRAVVTLTNTGRDTLHLASLAGTTPDFHASFFEHKSIPSGGNTTFTVVLVGLSLGPLGGALLVHSSRGLLRYGVSALAGPPSSGLWPLLGVVVPFNATLSEPLDIYNPTANVIQITEIYSSSTALHIALPDGSSSAAAAHWAVPAWGGRTLARLELPHAVAAWLRLRGHGANNLIMPVDAKAVGPGAYISPLQVRVWAAGAMDPPKEVTIQLGNTANHTLHVKLGVVCRCLPTPHHPAVTPRHAYSSGVTVTPLLKEAHSHQPLAPAARLTFNFAEMWSTYESEFGLSAGNEAWCVGWGAVGGRTLPFSARVLRGGVSFTPQQLEVVLESATSAVHTVRVHNQLSTPLAIHNLQYGPRLTEYFEVSAPSVSVACAGCEVTWCQLSLKTDAPTDTLDSWIELNTNVSRYRVPVLVYSGRIRIEWQWPASNVTSTSLALGALPVSSTRRVRALLRHDAPSTLCVTELHAQVTGAAADFVIVNCGPTQQDKCRCIPPGDSISAVLTVVAPSRSGPELSGVIRLATTHSASDTTLTVTPHRGAVSIRPTRLPAAAPYCHVAAPIHLDSSMQLPMTLINITQPNNKQDKAAVFQPSSGVVITAGAHTVGSVTYAAELACSPHCYAGLGALEERAWLQRAERVGEHTEEVIHDDLSILENKHCLYEHTAVNVTMLVHTTEVVQTRGWAHVPLHWPRLIPGGGVYLGASALQCGRGASTHAHISVRNPSASHSLLLQPVIASLRNMPNRTGSAFSPWCDTAKCVQRPEAFGVSQWTAVKGHVSARGGKEGAPLLLLAPGARVKITITFSPLEEKSMSAALYLRNNLTVLEAVPLSGQGSQPALTLNGQKPGEQPLLFDILDCGALKRVVIAKNCGAAPLRLSGWAIAGAPCGSRGFTLQPCTELTLQPNATHPFTFTFASDYSLSQVTAVLTVRTDAETIAFGLQARVSTAVIEECLKAAPRPPWEKQLRAAGALLAALAVALVLAAGALDAERLLRRAPNTIRQPRAALDLRAAALAPPVQPLPTKRTDTAVPNKKRRRKPDPVAEAKAFDQWRASLRPRAPAKPKSDDDANSTSSELSSSPNDQDDVDNEHEDDNDVDEEEHREEDAHGDEKLDIVEQNDLYEINDLDDLINAQRPVREETPPPPYESIAGAYEPLPPAAPRPRDATPRRRRAPTRRPPRVARRAPHSATPPAPDTPPVAAVTQTNVAANANVAQGNAVNYGSAVSAAASAGTVRWGTSWSSVVVGAPARPAPIGPPRPPNDQSLFYFNAARPNNYHFEPAVTKPNAGGNDMGNGNFAEEPNASPRRAPSNYGPWGAPSDWGWLRPPPGFAPPPAVPQPPAAPPASAPAPRAYDPFQSLAAVWSRTALDWREQDDDELNRHNPQ